MGYVEKYSTAFWERPNALTTRKPAPSCCEYITSGWRSFALPIRTVLRASPVSRITTWTRPLPSWAAFAQRGIARGVEISLTTNMRPLFDPYWQPLWAALNDARLPVHLHTIGQEMPDWSHLPPLSQRAGFAVQITGFQMAMAKPLMEAVYGGVFEAYPHIILVLGESGIGWIPYVLDHMDLEWEDQFKDLTLKMKPSEYWRRNCRATYQSDPVGIRCLDLLGEDNIMWGSDFPHPDGVWPDSQKFIAREMRDVDPAVRDKVIHGNAANLYGFPT